MATVPDPSAAPATRTCRWLRAIAFAAFIVGAFLIFRQQFHRPPQILGDVWEYWYQAESFHAHGSPELQLGDVENVNQEALRIKLGTAPVPPYAYAIAPDGRSFGMHFWSYGLSTVPAKEILRRSGVSELGDLGLANAGWFVLALGIALFGSKAPVGERLALASLAAVGPVYWYIAWPGAEIYSWSLALIAVVAFRDGRYGWAGVGAGLAALQNPPIAILGAAAVLAAAWERRWRSAAATIAGTAIAFVPFLFFQYHFGKPSLIADDSSVVKHLSWVRTWGLLTDFNQGLLPYAPMLALGAVIGAIRLVWTRNVRGLLLLAGGIGTAVGTQVAHNWNSGCDSLQRYLVWMVPLAAGVAVEGIGGRWRLWGFALAAVAVHAAVLNYYDDIPDRRSSYLKHSPAAEWMLTRCPQAYWVEPEIFVERQRHEDDWPRVRGDMPYGYSRADGTVSKLLLDSASVEIITVKYEVDAAFLTELKERATREPGLFYAHPPHGAVRVRMQVGKK